MRFYPGSSAMTWLAETPIAVINACQQMLPRIEAEESLLAASRVGLAGRMDGAVGQRQIKQWAAKAAGTSTDAGKPSGFDGSGLSLFGFGMRKVKVTGPRPKVGKGRRR